MVAGLTNTTFNLRSYATGTLRKRRDEMVRTFNAQGMTPELVASAITGLVADAIKQICDVLDDVAEDVKREISR